MKKYDVIVVGAGNGGLVAAATTAKAGYRTLLLEKHNLPGGCATSFVRGRFEFEPSLHELCSESTHEASRSTSRIFADLGADVPLYFENELFRVIARGEDGYDVTLPAGEAAFVDAMENIVPGCRASVQALFDLNREFDEAQLYMDGGAMNPSVLMDKYGDFVRACGHSVDELFDALGMPEKAQDIIKTYWSYLGVPTDDLNAMHYISLLCAYVEGRPSMPYHRSHELSLALAKAVQGFGGEIRYNTEVTRFLYDVDGAAIGVIAGGETILAKKVISNIIPNNVVNRSYGKRLPASMKKLVNARKLGLTFITIYLGLDCTMQELGVKDYSVFVLGDKNSRAQFDARGEFGMYIVNCLNRPLPESSPEGTCTLFFTLPFMPEDFPEELKPEEYKKFKNGIARKYIEDYEKRMGLSILPHIEEIAVATPVTFARYLGTPGGEIYGYASTEWDNVVNRTVFKDLENRIKNLYFCGGHSIRGDGFPSGYITGEMAALDAIRDLKEGK